MSGTSCDGLDIAHSLFWFENNKWIYKLKKYKSVSYSKKLKSRLLKCSKLDALSLKILDLDFGEYIKGEIKKFIKESNTRFDLISCHGHTVFHDAKNKINFQIGNPFIIYKSFQIPIVFNFRELDVIMGGQGAPLVPYGDKHLFYKEKIAPYKTELELWYLKNQSILIDLKLILITALVIVFPKLNVVDKFFKSIPAKPSHLN